jgi:hypothetical protein
MGYIDYASKVQISQANPGRDEITFNGLECYSACGPSYVVFRDIDSAFYRFLGSMSPANSRLLIKGEAVSFRSFTPSQMDWVRQFAYDNESMDLEGVPESASDCRCIPTELLPNGLPLNGFLRLKVKVEPAVREAPGAHLQVPLKPELTAQDLAFFMYMKTNPEMIPGIEPYLGDYKHFFVGEKTEYTFQFTFVPGAKKETTTEEQSFPVNSSRVGFEDLPELFRTQVEGALKQMKQYFDFDVKENKSPPVRE